MEIKDCIYYFSTLSEGGNSELFEVTEDTPKMDLPQIGKFEDDFSGKTIATKYYIKNPVCNVGGVVFLCSPFHKNHREYRIDIVIEDVIDWGGEIPQEIKDKIAQKIYIEIFDDLATVIEGEIHI